MKIKTLIIMMAVLFLAACSDLNQTSFNETSAPRQTEVAMDMVQESAPPAEQAIGENTAQTDRSIIYTASVNFETINYEEAKEELLELISQEEGNIQYQDESAYQYGQYTESAQSLTQLYLVIRVPQENFDDLVSSLENSEAAEVTQSSRGTEDVTNQVRDLDIRIESVEARIDRLNELNEEAETVTDLIEIETALQEAIIQRDQLLEQQSGLTDQVDYGTIYLSLREVIELSNRGGSQRTFWDDFQDALVETWYRALDALQTGIISVVFLIPYIIFILILIAIFKWLIRPLYGLVRRNFRRRNADKVSPAEEDTPDTPPVPDEETE